MRFVSKSVLACLVALGAAGTAQGATVTFSGSDDGVGFDGTPRPNSEAAKTAFESGAGALGTINLLNLDSLATGFSPVINLGSGVTATFTDARTTHSGIRTNASGGTRGELGFATSGPNFLQASMAATATEMNLKFDFATPVQAFGAYFTGLESNVIGTFTLNFNDGTAQTLSLPEGVTTTTVDGGAPIAFFGFTSAGASITSVTLTEKGALDGAFLRDVIGVDDIRFVNAGAPVPIPASVSLGLVGAGMIGGMTYLRRRRRQA
jgi:hypothetical protein